LEPDSCGDFNVMFLGFVEGLSELLGTPCANGVTAAFGEKFEGSAPACTFDKVRFTVYSEAEFAILFLKADNCSGLRK
jgi:hypothetical protein